MALDAQGFVDFAGGVNLATGELLQDPSQALDAFNVESNPHGPLGTRPAFRHIANLAYGASCGLGEHRESDGTRQLLAGAADRVQAVDLTGTVVATQVAGGAVAFWDFARLGRPATLLTGAVNEYTYLSNGVDVLWRWNGTAFASVAGSPKCRYLTLLPGENILVCAGFAGVAGGPGGLWASESHVWFSDAANPEGFTATSYVQVGPGDGEPITGVVSWHDLVFVFKASRYWTFYQTGVDAAGLPIFYKREQSYGVGLSYPGGVCAGRDGVYFCHHSGVYLVGGADAKPVLLTGKIDPVFGRGPVPAAAQAVSPINRTTTSRLRLRWSDDRLYLSFQDAGHSDRDTCWVADLRAGWWVPWRLDDEVWIRDCVDAVGSDGTPNFYFVLEHDGISGLCRLAPEQDEDLIPAIGSPAATPIRGYWQSGWVSDLEHPGERVVREARLWGEGVVEFSMAVDHRAAAGAIVVALTSSGDTWGDGTGADRWAGGGDASDRWGPAAQQGSALVRWAHRGRLFSHRFASPVGAGRWAVHRVEHHGKRPRQPTVETGR